MSLSPVRRFAATSSAAGHQAGRASQTGPARVRPPAAWPAVLAIAAAAFAVEMAVSARYGYHRDELYFLQGGRHPAAGYVDQPPLTPLAARAMSGLTGGSLAGLRALPALMLAALTVISAAISRILGGGRASQLLAAAATATCGEYLAGMHLLTTTTLDSTGASAGTVNRRCACSTPYSTTASP